MSMYWKATYHTH